ncbi:MAG: hypothetical protein HN366_04955 [Deltaproteobacteria bacterium]|jgi:hypothetical protein|nr:hypothetical protein [Deltaproteobacteria bacterium]
MALSVKNAKLKELGISQNEAHQFDNAGKLLAAFRPLGGRKSSTKDEEAIAKREASRKEFEKAEQARQIPKPRKFRPEIVRRNAPRENIFKKIHATLENIVCKMGENPKKKEA